MRREDNLALIVRQLARLLFDCRPLPRSGVGRKEEVPGIELIETAGDLAGQFDVSGLILPYRDEGGLVKKNVSRLKQRIAEETERRMVLLAKLLLLVLVGRNTLQPGDRSDHAQQIVQFK